MASPSCLVKQTRTWLTFANRLSDCIASRQGRAQKQTSTFCHLVFPGLETPGMLPVAVVYCDEGRKRHTRQGAPGVFVRPLHSRTIISHYLFIPGQHHILFDRRQLIVDMYPVEIDDMQGSMGIC